MGASGWAYSVPFRPDMQAALDELRQKVYDEGDYLKIDPNPDLSLPLDQFVAKYDSAHDDGILEAMLEARERFEALPRPTDPDSLLEWQGSEGTHSIIDMANGVTEKPQIFAVAPITERELLAVFGTVRPHIDQVQIELARGWIGERERWHGTYLLSYRDDGSPDAIHFVGCSGD
jgi:hypothetical protein